jgi:hypothetical protein
MLTRNLVAASLVAFATACSGPAGPTSTSIPLTPAPAATAAEGSVVVESASMIEFQYPAGLPNWSYSPQIRVMAATGQGSVLVTGADLTSPGLVPRPLRCSTAQRLDPGESRELFGEIYGDYPLTIDNSKRASADATIVLHFTDASGRAGAITATAPITPGGLPATYSGGTGTWLTCTP